MQFSKWNPACLLHWGDTLSLFFCFCKSATNLLRFPAFLEEDDDLNAVLCEFDAVIEDFTSPVEKRHFRYDEHLKTMKRRSSASVSDSGISDSESEYEGESWFYYFRRMIEAPWSHYLRVTTKAPQPQKLQCIILSNLIWAHTQAQRTAGFH